MSSTEEGKPTHSPRTYLYRFYTETIDADGKPIRETKAEAFTFRSANNLYNALAPSIKAGLKLQSFRLTETIEDPDNFFKTRKPVIHTNKQSN